MTFLTRQTLLNLGYRQEIIPFHQSTQLANKRNMLGNISTQSPELGILLDEALHICDCLYPRRRSWADGGVLHLVVRYVCCDRCTEITEV